MPVNAGKRNEDSALDPNFEGAQGSVLVRRLPNGPNNKASALVEERSLNQRLFSSPAQVHCTIQKPDNRNVIAGPVVSQKSWKICGQGFNDGIHKRTSGTRRSAIQVWSQTIQMLNRSQKCRNMAHERKAARAILETEFHFGTCTTIKILGIKTRSYQEKLSARPQFTRTY